MALSVELGKIRRHGDFATGLAEAALEDIIEGDWKRAAMFVKWVTFEDARPCVRDHYTPLWEDFRTILQAAVNDARIRAQGESR